MRPDLYEPELNPEYAALLAHYRCVADPARVPDPNRKATVDSAIQHTQDTALKGRRFDSLQAQNEFVEYWECNWGAKRIHGREKASFALFEEMVRTVGDDRLVRVDSSYYAARPAAIGSR